MVNTQNFQVQYNLLLGIDNLAPQNFLNNVSQNPGNVTSTLKIITYFLLKCETVVIHELLKTQKPLKNWAKEDSRVTPVRPAWRMKEMLLPPIRRTSTRNSQLLVNLQQGQTPTQFFNVPHIQPLKISGLEKQLTVTTQPPPINIQPTMNPPPPPVLITTPPIQPHIFPNISNNPPNPSGDLPQTPSRYNTYPSDNNDPPPGPQRIPKARRGSRNASGSSDDLAKNLDSGGYYDAQDMQNATKKHKLNQPPPTNN
ncbi:unnamed protein product [Allacma fusca]|uniref:Uncharacterized protein n=1 Tax=Allacma fusca TaxID=39272 RepID=A0A8J2KPH6_9HEXA|nr:unnamed protein product [Allacma fusca]